MHLNKLFCTQIIKVLFLCLLVFITALTSAFSLQNKIKKIDCVTNDFPPYGFKRKGKLVGIEVEILGEIAKRLNLSISLEMLPWVRVLESVKSGEKDCMFAAFKTTEREIYMKYMTVPFHVSSLSFFIHNSSKIKQTKDLYGKKIGLVRGFTAGEKFEKEVKNKVFKVDPLSNFERGFLKLEKSRIDAILINHHVGLHIVRNQQILDIKELPTTYAIKSAYITFTRKKNFSDLPALFDRVLFDIYTDGTYNKILKKYL